MQRRDRLTGLFLLALLTPLAAQTRVDLRSRQTPLKDQGGRTTCITFSAIAAMEAAYKRAGYGNLDLSEEFTNYMGKMNWLHENFSQIGTVYQRENQVGMYGGGNGSGYLQNFKDWLRVPTENYMAYRPNGYNLPYPYGHRIWSEQFYVNTTNLDPKHLPRVALNAPRYYSIGSYIKINARSIPQIEGALRAGREVVWDFNVKGSTGSTWNYSSTAKTLGAHSMLIVGYDRSSSNPKNHVFICKNSWGRGSSTRGDGYTYIHYDYLRYNGLTAAYVTSVRTPSPWPELAAIGRYNLSFDGHQGFLDIYHIPGSAQYWLNAKNAGVTDRRLGTFRDSKGNMFRVNGKITGNRVEFWFAGSRPNLGYGDTRTSPVLCRRFIYHIVDGVRGELAGYHYDNAGSIPSPAYGGYARRPSTMTGTQGILAPQFSAPSNASMYLGLWKARFDRTDVDLIIQKRDDLAIPSGLRSAYYGLRGEMRERYTGTRRSFVVYVRKSRVNEVRISFKHSTKGSVNLHGYMLNWQRGVFAGPATSGGSSSHAFYAWRSSSAEDPGSVVYLGSGCRGSNGVFSERVSPAPFVGRSTTWTVTGGPAQGSGLFTIGVQRTNFVFPGTACVLRVVPAVTAAVRFDKSGGLRLQATLNSDPRYKGLTFYTQFAGFDPQANAAGFILSRGTQLRVGGYK